MGKKIFIVDDEEHIIRSLIRELSDWGKENDILFNSFTNPIDVLNALKKIEKYFLLFPISVCRKCWAVIFF